MSYPEFGTVSHGTMRAEDLIPEFAYALRQLCGKDTRHLDLCREADAIVWEAIEADPEAGEEAQDATDQDEIDGILEELFDALNAYAPPYGYFGAHPGDSSDYGFWLSEFFEEEFDGLKVDDLSEVPAGYAGEVMVINDHGNISLYAYDEGSKEPRNIWSVV